MLSNIFSKPNRILRPNKTLDSQHVNDKYNGIVSAVISDFELDEEPLKHGSIVEYIIDNYSIEKHKAIFMVASHRAWMKATLYDKIED